MLSQGGVLLIQRLWMLYCREGLPQEARSSMNYLLSSMIICQGHLRLFLSSPELFPTYEMQGWASNCDFLIVFPAALLHGKWAKIRFLLKRRV